MVALSVVWGKNSTANLESLGQFGLILKMEIVNPTLKISHSLIVWSIYTAAIILLIFIIL